MSARAKALARSRQRLWDAALRFDTRWYSHWLGVTRAHASALIGAGC